MSVLKSLKGTLQNVQQDIVDSFRALTSLDSTPRHEKIKQLRADGINLDAGADLLYRYQKDWSELHGYTTETAKKAEEVDAMVSKLFSKQQQRFETACRLEEETTALPTLATTIQDMIQLIGSLQQDLQAVEAELDKLQNVCEEEELEREKDSHLAQLAAYKKSKMAEAYTVKGKLWNMLKDKAKESEKRKSHAMKERQEAFLDAFTSDMDYYRKHGHADKLPGVADFPKVSSLSEITIEDDKKELDEFLSSGEGDHHAEEEAFIEDDYTTDYRATHEDHDDFPELDVSKPIDFDAVEEDTAAASHSEETTPASDSKSHTEESNSAQADAKAEQTQETGDTESQSVPDETEGDDSKSNKEANGDAPKPTETDEDPCANT